MTKFSNFDLLPTIKATLAEKELVTPTEIQTRAIPVLLSGKSVVGVSQTGSGKTLAFALPILHQLKTLENNKDPVRTAGQPRACVIVPTRELGEQVSKVFKPFTHTTRLRVRTVLGGTTFEIARKNVNAPFDVLVATPGRLVKMLEMGILNLTDVRVLVFDEADLMLDQGFLPDATKIVKACPPNRQLALFSATVSKAVQSLMEKLFAGAEVIRSGGSHKTVPTLATSNKEVVDGKRFPLLEEVLEKKVKGGTLIFTNTREQCDKLAEKMKQSGRECVVYRGEMDKVERRKNLKSFRDGTVDYLISTDLASRGLDLDLVGRVINYHLPLQMENYLHRVGRTARAGRQGLVINFVTERDEKFIEKLANTMASEEWPSEPEHKTVIKIAPKEGITPAVGVAKKVNSTIRVKKIAR
jgi:ATP-dependent RNA helicase RhlE